MSTYTRPWGAYLERTGKTPRKTASKVNPYADPNGLAWTVQLLAYLGGLDELLGDDNLGNACRNALRHILQASGIAADRQAQIVKTILDGTSSADDAPFFLLTALASTPALDQGLAKAQADPDSEYHAALAFHALTQLAAEIGTDAKNKWLDRQGYRDLSWQEIAFRAAAALDDLDGCTCNGVNNPNGCPACRSQSSDIPY